MAYTREQYLEAAAKADADGNPTAAAELRALAASVEPPTERARAMAQGATFGFADEILAGLQAPFGPGSMGENYDAALQQERGVLKQYKKDYPLSSAAYEVGGAILPALLTGGGSTAVSAARAGGVVGGLARGAISGAKAGAAYGFGTGEGGAMKRVAGMGAGAAYGGLAGGALGAAGGALKGVGGRLTDWVRNKSGNRIAGVVAREVQRLVEQGGMTADEVVEGVAQGRIMVENRTLESMIRKFYSEGGPAGAEIKTVMSARPGETRAAAMGELQGALGSPGNPLARRRASEELTKQAENAAYESAFRPSGVELPAPPEVVAQMADIATRAPGALKNAAEVARVKYGIRPFFTEAPDGTIAFAREPTLREAELIYRSLRDMKGEAFKSGRGTLGGAYSDLAEGFKGQVDIASPPLAAARAEAATVRNARDAFTAGQEAIRKSPDELALIIQDVEALGPDALAAFREGMLTSVRAGMSKPSAAPGLMRGLANEETGPGTALRLALPPGVAPAVTQKIGIAEDAQRAYKNIIEGSQTAPTVMAPSIGGAANLGQQAVATATDGGLMSWLQLIGGAADRLKPNLTDAQRLQIARVVLSTDPALVSRALQDESLTGQVMAATAKAIDQLTQTGARAAGAGTGVMTSRDR